MQDTETKALGGRGRGIALIVLATVSFGSMSIFARVAYADGSSTLAVLFLRFMIAGLILSAAMAVLKLAWPRGRSLAILIGMGAIGYVAQASCLFVALRYSSPGLVALLPKSVHKEGGSRLGGGW